MCNCCICISKRRFICGCKKLPIELITHIFSYIYSPQSPKLLYDIRDYGESKETVYEIYRSYYTPTIMHHKMAFDVFLITNRYVDYLQDGFLHNFYEIWMRDLRLQTIEAVDNFVSAILERRNPKSVFSLFWGLMNEKEREFFIQVAKKIAKIFTVDPLVVVAMTLLDELDIGILNEQPVDDDNNEYIEISILL
jgi:hypothetical protein